MPDRRLVPSLIVAGLLGLAGTTPSLALARQPVVDCDSSAMEDINWALDFATAHVEPVLAQATYLPSKYTDRIRKDWDKTSVKCSNKKSCNETTGKLGFDRGGNQIKLCWDNIRSLPKTVFRCDLVKIIFHEKGHAANIPIEARHNEWPTGYPYVPHIDLVYRLGDDAESYCISLATCSPGAVVPKELKLKGLGESCTLDGNCASAHCEGAKCAGGVCTPGVCQCQTVDWSAGFLPVESASAGNLAIGEFCSRDTQCAGGHCERGTCTCKIDKDCPGKLRCVNRLGKNFCVPEGRGLGSFCEKDADCPGTTCNNNSCVCDGDKDCTAILGGNPRCDKPFGKKNFCQPTAVARDHGCNRDSDCNSGHCKKDLCVP